MKITKLSAIFLACALLLLAITSFAFFAREKACNPPRDFDGLGIVNPDCSTESAAILILLFFMNVLLWLAGIVVILRIKFKK